MKCGKELTQLDRGAYRKFVNRGSTSFLCKSCLAEKFGIKECVLDEKIEQLKTNPALSGLKAVQEENFLVITLPEVFASSRIADTIEKFAKGFHPDLFTEAE